MNIFTNDDYKRIQAWLKANAIKDSDLVQSETTIPDEDILTIVQKVNGIPTNFKINIKDFLNSSLNKIIIKLFTVNAIKVNNSLVVDIDKIIINEEENLTLQAVFDSFNNQLNDVSSASKGWNIEYQAPSIDEPTVRAKYVLKDYKGVPKGDPIKVYKDSAITNVYLGTTEDTCNENTGEVTKKPIQNNNEALSIVYRLDTGKYSLVNIPIGIFIKEAEFDKYRGLGITENGQVFIKLASDIESSNYLHFNASGELSADGIENRILQDLGTIINSVAGDGTMWGQYKKEEGTKDSPTNEASRWGQYKQAEASRNERLNNLENKIEEVKQEIIYNVSAHNSGAVFESLSALLNSSDLNTLIPTSVRHGGMTIKFIHGSAPNSDNKYVQYRLMAQTFSTNKSDWQGVDDEPTVGSDNLVKSGGVANAIETETARAMAAESAMSQVMVNEVSRLNNLIYNEEYLTLSSYERVTGLIKAEDGTLDLSFGEHYTHDVYEVEPNIDYRVSSQQTGISGYLYALISFFDADGTYIKDGTVVSSMNEGNSVLDNYKVTSPSNASTMKVASWRTMLTEASKITYINGIQKNSEDIAEEKAAIMGTDRIADGAVTTEKLAESAMSQTMENEIARLEGLIIAEDLSPLSTERVTGLIKAIDGTLDLSFGEYYTHYVCEVEPNTDYKVNSPRTDISGDQYALISFFDAEGTYIKDSTVLSSMNEGSSILNNYKVTSPSNASTMKVASCKGTSIGVSKITYVNGIQKNREDIAEINNKSIVAINEKLDISNFEIFCCKNRCKKLENSNPFTYKPFDKAYIIMTIDDGNINLPPFFDLCKALDIPLSPAVPPTSMTYKYTSGYNYENNTEVTVNSRTIKDVCTEIVSNGGEVLSHNYKVIGVNSTEDKYLEIFRDSKIQLMNYGFYPRGIILSGGGPDSDGDESISANQTVYEKCQSYSQMYYDFSDLYGTKEPYRHPRFCMWGFNSIDAALNNISQQINNKRFIVIATHGSTDVNSIENVKNMRVFLERIKSQFVDTGQAEFTTWSRVYDSFKSTELEQRLIALEQAKI